MRSAAAVGALALVAMFLPPAPATALGCSTGQNKFVQRNNAGGNYSYGSMGTVWNGENLVIDTCGVLIHSVHLYFGTTSGHLDFAEIGSRQYGQQRGSFVIFTEWSLYPYTALDQSTTSWATDQYMSFNVSNEFGTYPRWKFQYSLGDSQSGWTTYGAETSSFALWYSNGIPLSEVERFGNTDAYIYARNLKYRPASGGWYTWEGMTCATMYGDQVADWDADRITASSWQTLHQPHAANDC